MSKDEFNVYLENLKNSENTIHLLDNKYFYVLDIESLNLIIDLNKKINELDMLINSFTDFSKKQIIQSFLIDEIDSSNKIENVYSTKHDIFSVINNVSSSNNKKIISISNAYKHLLETKGQNIKKVEDIRTIYDIILNNAVEVEDLPDGKIFRKNNVFITDGINVICSGVINEENITRYMEEFIRLYNSNNNIFIRMILCHFVFEYTHPFYDGNGRLGRFLFSNGLYLSSIHYFAFLISSSFKRGKNKYYKAFKEADDKYEFGCLNNYVEIIFKILISEIDINIKNLKNNKEKIDCLTFPYKLSKTEQKIYKLISEASLFSTFGVSNQEIIKEIGASKRSLIYALNEFKSKNMLNVTKIGKFNYYKIV